MAARPSRPASCVLGRDVLPVEQEADEVAHRHRLDLPPQAVERAPVDPGQQAAVAPLQAVARAGARSCRAGPRPASSTWARARLDVGGAKAEDAPASARRRGRTAERQAGPHHLGQRPVAVGEGRRPARGRLDHVGHEAAVGPDERRQRAPLGRHPERPGRGRLGRVASSGGPRGSRPPAPASSGSSRGPRPSLVGQGAQVEQQVVQLVGGLGPGLRLLDHRRHRLGVERAQALDDLGRQPAPHRDRARAPLLEGGVVEEGVGVGVQDLVREGGGLGHVARDPPDAPACQLAQEAAQALGVGGLDQAVADGLLDQGVVGHARPGPPPWLSWQAV